MVTAIRQASALLAQARKRGRPVRMPPPLRPFSVVDAYAIQDAVDAELGAPRIAPGWKVGAPDPHTEPSAAPIHRVLSSPAHVPAAQMTMLAVEAELAAVFGRALPARSEPYDAAEVMAAVRELRVAIKLCDSRVQDWEQADELTRLADHQMNFALVLGDAVERFADLDFGRLTVVTRVDGNVIAEGTGCHAVGNPLDLLPWLANHARLRGGITEGTAVTTGAWLGLHRVEPGAAVTVEFDGLGSAQVAFPA